MTSNNDNLWGAIGSVALGLIGGYLLIELLKNIRKCRSCGNQIPPKIKYAPIVVFKMTNTFNIEENIKYIRKGSLIGLIIVVGVLFFSYYNLFKYFNVEINNIFVLLSWIYLFLNIGIANLIKYVNEKNMPECPKCKNKLQIRSYLCKNCGKINFKKDKNETTNKTQSK